MMFQGVLLSILAGIMVSVQSVINSRVSEKAGLWLTNTFVHGTGFLLSFLILLISMKKANIAPIKSINPLYLTGGMMGAVVVFSVMKGISTLGVSKSITILLVSQIIVSVVINYFGFFGEEVLILSTKKIIGLALMVSGIILYQLT